MNNSVSNSVSNYSSIERIEKLIENETDPIKRVQYRQQLRTLLKKLDDYKRGA